MVHGVDIKIPGGKLHVLIERDLVNVHPICADGVSHRDAAHTWFLHHVRLFGVEAIQQAVK